MDEKEKMVYKYLPLIKKEVYQFKDTYISKDELESEAYFIFAKALKEERQKKKTFPSYIKKSIHLGLLRYVIRERKLRERFQNERDR